MNRLLKFALLLLLCQSASSQNQIKWDEVETGMILVFNEDYVFPEKYKHVYFDTAQEFRGRPESYKSRISIKSNNGDVVVPRGSKTYATVVWNGSSYDSCFDSRVQSYFYSIYLTKTKPEYNGLSRDRVRDYGTQSEWSSSSTRCAPATAWYVSDSKIPGLSDFKSNNNLLTIEFVYKKGDQDASPSIRDLLHNCCEMNVSIERDRAKMKIF